MAAMGLWSKLLGTKADEVHGLAGSAAAPSLLAPSPGEPTTIAAIAGKLTVTFYAHDSVEGARGNFLSAVSRGFGKHKQGELVVTLRLSADDDVPGKMDEIRRFFVSIHAWVRQRRLAVAGGLTQFGERAPFGRSRSGILYTDARPIDGVEIPRGALAAVLVDEQEIRTAMDYGAYRILSRIGEQYRHFPFPTWNDLGRKSVVIEREREHETVLAKLARSNAPNASFLVEDEKVTVWLAARLRAGLGRGIASLPARAAFALLVKPSPKANALLVWHPGQKEPAAISPDGADGSRISGSCLLIVPNAKEDRIRLTEDGYSLLISADSWAKLSAALVDERPFSLRLAEGVRLSVELLPDDSMITA